MEAVAGLIGALVGGAIAWRVGRSTNQIQAKIAADSASLQQAIADANTKLQKDLANENARSQERTTIDAMLIKMIDISLQYPYVEKHDFCRAYPDCKTHPHGKERYENYCIFVFNFLSKVFKHFGGESQKIEDYIGVDEIVVCHCNWWLHDVENLGYDKPFRQYIQGVIDRSRKAEKIK